MSLEGRPDRRLPTATDLIAFVTALSPVKRRLFVAELAFEDGTGFDGDWQLWGHDGQHAPAGDWSTWVLMAGRGFGKTLAGAQWLTDRVSAQERGRGKPLSIALVGASLEDTRRVMIEGRSGLLVVAEPLIAEWTPSLRRLRFKNGAEAVMFSGCSPDLLRGPEHHLAWCDELAKWERPKDCWDMLQFGLRLDDPASGTPPRALITTTPGSGPVLGAIMAAPGTVVTRGRTAANPHTSRAWKAQVAALYAGTRLGQQELEGELLPEAGALWTPELIEKCRVFDPPRDGEVAVASATDGGGSPPATTARPAPSTTASRRSPSPSRGGFERTLIGVDPPSGDGTCGIVACARGPDGIGHVLADHSVTGRSPEGWARAVADAAAAHGTDEVIAEANQGGKMVKAVLLTAEPGLRVRLVNATVGKSARAEPVSHLFEAGKVRLWGKLPELEAQLCGMIAGGGYEGPGTSPDRADAMVWGLGEVMRERSVRVREV